MQHNIYYCTDADRLEPRIPAPSNMSYQLENARCLHVRCACFLYEIRYRHRSASLAHRMGASLPVEEGSGDARPRGARHGYHANSFSFFDRHREGLGSFIIPNIFGARPDRATACVFVNSSSSPSALSYSLSHPLLHSLSIMVSSLDHRIPGTCALFTLPG